MALVATLSEFKAWINYGSGTGDDTELTDVLTSASEWVEFRLSTFLEVTAVTESIHTRGWTMTPAKRLIAAVSSITREEGGGVVASSSYKVDTTNDLIRFYRAVTPGWYTLAYTAGMSSIPKRAKTAGLELARHLWLTQNGSAGRGRPSSDDIPVPMGFAVPRRVEELITSLPTAFGGFA